MDVTALFRGCVPVSLEEMLAARENRAAAQKDFRQRHSLPLIGFTLNIPGPVKAYPLALAAFREGKTLLDAQLRQSGFAVVEDLETEAKTGYEALYAVRGDAAALKRLAMRIEDGHPLGRLFDIDVIGPDGVCLRGEQAGRGERVCIVCGRPVWECARSRAHPADELALRTAGLIREHFDGEYADRVAAAATQALLHEVATTPKPGLVDRANNGSHRDMTFFTFIDSSVVLTPYFRDMTRRGLAFTEGADCLLQSLRLPGWIAERRMFDATGGVNTHKGLVFSLGILCAAAGWIKARGLPEAAGTLLDASGAIARGAADELQEGPLGDRATHGERVYEQFGLTGVRGEAAAGYPHVLFHGYPALRRALDAGCCLNDAGVIALLHLMAVVEDTNLVARSDLATLRAVQAELAELLKRETDPRALLLEAERLDALFIERRLSPGGSADLLALTFFLYFLFDSIDES